MPEKLGQDSDPPPPSSLWLIPCQAVHGYAWVLVVCGCGSVPLLVPERSWNTRILMRRGFCLARLLKVTGCSGPPLPPRHYRKGGGEILDLSWNSWTSISQKTRVFCSMSFTVPSTGGFQRKSYPSLVLIPLQKNPQIKKTQVYSWIAFCRTVKWGKETRQKSNLRRLEFMPRNLD
jgi:hypothetical protein